MDLVNLSGRSGIWWKSMSRSCRVVGGRRSRGLRFSLVVVLLAGSVFVSSGGGVSAQDDNIDLVSNLGLSGATTETRIYQVQGRVNNRGVAQSFTTGSRRNGYLVSEVAIELRAGTSTTADVNLTIYDDNGSNSPGEQLHAFPQQTVPAGRNRNNVTFTGDAAFLLGSDTKYWLVLEALTSSFAGLWGGNNAGRTSTPADGWSIAPQYALRHSPSSFTVQSTAGSLKFRIRGSEVPDEIQDERDFPGGDFAPDASTAGVVRPRVAGRATGELTRADDARPSGSASGNRWNGDVFKLVGFDQNRRYRVEVLFGHSATRSTGGSISVFSVDSRGVNRSHGEFWDHNRDDGQAFIEFTPGRDLGRGRTYYLEVEARDGMQTEAVINQFGLSRNFPDTRVPAAQFFGEYSVFMNDITVVTQLVANTSLKCDDDDDPVARVGHKSGSGVATERFEHFQDFTTGSNTGGYRLYQVEAFFSDLDSGDRDNPKVEVWDTATTPAKVVDMTAPLFNINRVVSPRSTVRFTSDGTIVLSADTTYRLVFSETKDTGDDFESYNMNLYPGDCSYQERDNAAGWSIATSYSQSKEGVTTVTTGTPSGSTLRIGVYGEPVGGV